MAGKDTPPWLIPVAVVVIVLCVGFVVFKAMGHGSGASSAPDVAVKPGMFDFRKEAASGNLGKGTGPGLKGSTP